MKTKPFLGQGCVIAMMLLCLFSCEKSDTPLAAYKYPFSWESLPKNFPLVAPFPDNPQTKEGVELGRMLFFDVALSGANDISCGSCHQPEKYFSDGIPRTNIGADKSTLHRHTPVIFNMAWQNNGLFWDGGARNLESLSVAPITSIHEMNQDLKQLSSELQNRYDYKERFERAFPDKKISTQNILRALAQYQRAIISANSRYDKFVRNEGERLSALELKGLHFFEQHCRRCHSTDLFTDTQFHNNGLDSVFSEEHERIAFGHGRVSFDSKDIGKYKTPSLRNVARTAPYMHDGRFSTLQEVLQHYVNGMKYSPTIDEGFRRADGTYGIALSKEEQEAIIAFLHTLTDEDFLKNPLIQNPFKH
ncbi:MAG: c-type cytochrome [Cytophagales bacterium]|nr:c-type cytochrome [Cytophagales bacterium]MDW8383965.1 cytochrome c peroxidase [Flammeovirgaceae bacterium]